MSDECYEFGSKELNMRFSDQISNRDVAKCIPLYAIGVVVFSIG